MAIGRTNAGGGTSLNFKVVGGTTKPTSPKENTIWVNTDVAIPSWAFSATEPESPEAGMVWFSVGTNSGMAFNALRKNDIHVYPKGVKQYIGGEWVSKVFEAYQAGRWKVMIAYLYNLGDKCIELTGGWNAYAYKRSGDNTTAKAPTVKFGSNSITISLAGASSPREGSLFAENAIDLTDMSTLKINVTSVDANVSTVIRLAICDRKANNFLTKAETTLGTTTAGKHSVDVSGLTGLHYVCVNVGRSGYDATATFDAVWMEV